LFSLNHTKLKKSNYYFISFLPRIMARFSFLLLMLLSLLPLLMAAGDTRTKSSDFSQRDLQEGDEDDHDHDGDGVADHAAEEHMDEEEDEHADHDHDDTGLFDMFEWAGVFHLESGSSYILTFKPPAHDEEEDHEGHDHRALQEVEEDHDHDGDGEADHTAEEHNATMEEDHDHDGDGEADHTAEEHDDLEHDHDGDGVADHAAEDHADEDHMDEDYHFFFAVVPVDAHGAEGIEQAISMLDTSVVQQVANGESIVPSTDQVYELYFPASNTTTVPLTVVINVTTLGEEYVLMLPGTPSEVAGSDKIIMESVTEEKIFPEDVLVLESESTTTVVVEPSGAVSVAQEHMAIFGAMVMLVVRLFY